MSILDRFRSVQLNVCLEAQFHRLGSMTKPLWPSFVLFKLLENTLRRSPSLGGIPAVPATKCKDLWRIRTLIEERITRTQDILINIIERKRVRNIKKTQNSTGTESPSNSGLAVVPAHAEARHFHCSEGRNVKQAKDDSRWFKMLLVPLVHWCAHYKHSSGFVCIRFGRSPALVWFQDQNEFLQPLESSDIEAAGAIAGLGSQPGSRAVGLPGFRNGKSTLLSFLH